MAGQIENGTSENLPITVKFELAQEGVGEQTEARAENFLGGLTAQPRQAGQDDPKASKFQLIFLSILALTFFSALANLYLVTLQSAADSVRNATEGFATTWKLGFGAVVGLLAA